MNTFARLASGAMARPRVNVILLFLLVAFCGAGLPGVSPDFSLTSFFGGDDPARLYFEEHREYWGADDDVMIVAAKAVDGTMFTPSRLNMLQELTEALEAEESVRQVYSLPNMPRMYGGPGILDLGPLIESIPLVEDAADPAFQAWKQELIANTEVIPRLLSADEQVAAIAVEMHISSDELVAMIPLVGQIRDVVERFEGREGVVFVEAGVPAVRADFFSAVTHDQAVFGTLGAFLIAGFLGLMFRSVHGLLIPLTAAFLPLFMLMGIMGWTGAPITLVSSTYVTLLPAIAVADTIHLMTRFHEEARRRAPAGQRMSPSVRREAILAACGEIGAACLLTTITTAVGFGSLYVAKMPVLRSFGLYAALGVVIAYGMLLIAIPLMMSRVTGVIPTPKEKDGSRMDRLLLACGRVGIERSGLVLMVTAALIVAGIHFGSKTVVDNQLSSILPDTHETSRANQLVDGSLGGILTLDIGLEGPPDSLKQPEVLAALDGLGIWIQGLDGVRGVDSPATLVASLNHALTGERTVPTSSRRIAQLLLMVEGEEPLETLASPDFERGRVILRITDCGGICFEGLTDRLQEETNRRLRDVSISGEVTGVGHVAYRGINDVTRDLRNSLGFAFVIIALIIGVLFRDPRITLLSLVPNALPLLGGYALLGAMGWLLDPTPAMVFVLGLGIAVDDTIHLLHRFQYELRRGLSHHEAILQAVLHSGRAVAVTSVILICGLGLNVFSSFPANQTLGGLGASVIGLAFLCDVFVLPALLARYGGGAAERLKN